MTLSDFKLLDPVVQDYIVHDRGIELAVRKAKGRQMTLYHVDAFYVEVSYLPGSNTVTMIRSFRSDTLLQPYLEQIDITGLLS